MISKAQLDEALNNLLWSHSWPCLEQEFGLETFWVILWFTSDCPNARVSTRNWAVWGGNKQVRVVSPMQNLTVSDSLRWICVGELRALNEIYGFLKNIWVPFLQRRVKRCVPFLLLVGNWTTEPLLHKHSSEKVKEPYLVKDLYVKRNSRSMWPVGKQLGNLFK